MDAAAGDAAQCCPKYKPTAAGTPDAAVQKRSPQDASQRRLLGRIYMLPFLILLLCLSTVKGKEAQPEQVEVLKQCRDPGFVRATSDDELQVLYRDNLEPDFRPYMGQRYRVAQLAGMLDTLAKGRPQKYLFLIVFRSNTVHTLPLAPSPMPLTISRMNAMRQGLYNATLKGLKFPDSVMLMNVWDEGRCLPLPDDPNAAGAFAAKLLSRSAASEAARRAATAAGKAGSSETKTAAAVARSRPGCPVPVFSLIKLWNFTAPSSSSSSSSSSKQLMSETTAAGRSLMGSSDDSGGDGGSNSGNGGAGHGHSGGRHGAPIHRDVLLPFFNHVYEDLIRYPWAKKKPRALMRAAMQRNMANNCTRMWIIKLMQRDAEGARLIDAGITNLLKSGLKTPLADFVTIPDHARWRYLLSADGFTASCRFGKLLQTDSVVLKEKSSWIEYYYRSVQAEEHYVPFTKDTVMSVLQSLKGRDAQLRDIAARAQRFAYRYLSQHAKAMYVRRAAQTYNALFEDMQAFMDTLPAAPKQPPVGGPGVNNAGDSSDDGEGVLTFTEVLEKMKAYVASTS